MKQQKIFLLVTAALLTASTLGFVFRDDLKSVISRPYWKYRYGVVQAPEIDQQIAFLQARIEKKVSVPMDRAMLAQVYVSQGRLTGDATWMDRAEAETKISLAEMPTLNVGAMLVVAQIHDFRHEFTKAIEQAKEILKIKPLDSGALAVLVNSYLAVGEASSAIPWAERLADRRPFLSSFLVRAQALVALGRDEEALHDFKRAIRVEDLGEAQESARARVFLARFLSSRGKNSEAVSILNETLRFLPSYQLALYQRGLVKLKLHQWKEAEKDLSDAFTASKRVAYLLPYAKAQRGSGQTAAAEETWTSAEKLLRTELTTGAYGHRLDLAKLLLDRGKKEGFVEALKLAHEEYQTRKNADTIATLARALVSIGKFVEAKAVLTQALSHGEREAEYFTLAGKIERQLGDFSRAKLLFDIAVDIDPSFLEAKEERAGLLRDRPRQG